MYHVHNAPKMSRVILCFLLQITISECHDINLSQIGRLTLCPEFVPQNSSSLSEQILELPNHLLSTVYTRNNITNVQFRLNKNYHVCENGDSTETTIELSPSDSEEEIWDPTKPIFSPTGQLQLENEIYYNTEFCIQRISGTQMDITICNRPCNESDHGICIPKCCNMGQIFKLRNSDFKCSFNYGKHWSPNIHSDTDHESELNQSVIDKLTKQFYFHDPAPFCEENEVPEIITLEGIKGIQDGTPFRLIRDGTVKILKASADDWEILREGTFCLEGLQDVDPKNNNIDGLKMKTVLLHCTKSTVDFEPPKESVIYSSAMFVSAICLLITIIVNFLAPSHQKSYRWSLMSYFFSFFFMQIFLGITRLLPYFEWRTIAYEYEEDPVPRRICVGIGICAHFFCLMTFCWLTSINVEIWSTFRQIRLKTDGGYMKYCLQSLFSLIVSVPIVVTAVILENIYGDNAELEEHAWVVTPGYGQTTCFLEPIHASFYYLFLPIGLMILTNTCLFTMTVFTIWKTKRNTQHAAKQSTQQNNSSIFVFLKLYLIMGIPWTFEFMLWAFTRHEKDNPWYYQIIDILVTLQGVAILYIFCLRGETGRALLQKYPILKNLHRIVSIPSCYTNSNSKTKLDTITGSNISTGKLETSESAIGNNS